jgi:hypothetical protein
VGKYDGRTCLAIVFFRVVNAQIILQVTVNVKVKTEGYFLLLLYIYNMNMSSELNLLELYLNLLEHRDPRFSDVFAPYRGFGEFQSI